MSRPLTSRTNLLAVLVTASLRKDPSLSILSSREPQASQQLLSATWWPWLEHFSAVPPGPVLGLLSTGGARHS